MNNLALYHINRARMRTGDGLIWQSKGSAIGHIIRWKTGSWINHIGALTESRYSDRKLTHEALEKGPLPYLLSDRLMAYNGKCWWIQLRPAYDRYRTDIGCRLEDQLGTSYDWGALVKQLFCKVSVDARRYFCSESFFAALKGAGIPDLQDIEKAPNPGDFLRWPELKELFRKPVRIL